jgi:dihydrofolate synthase/folylpolyglutamate synthase
MTYAEALEALGQALRFGVNPTVEGVGELLEELGRPQDRFAAIQITGTNGKTSTARMLAAFLIGEGRRVGLYTSPHLAHYPERIEVFGVPVDESDFARGIGAALAAARRLRGPHAVGTPAGFTEFELLTAACFWLFAAAGVELAVLEVGLGGRWDATSASDPSVAVITGIGLDHTDLLGETLHEIAEEKAGIIKAGCTPVLGPGTDGLDATFIARADEFGLHPRAVREDIGFSPVPEDLTIRYRVTDRPRHPGGMTVLEIDGVHARYEGVSVAAPSYQAANAATAMAAAEAALGRALEPVRVRSALSNLALPGRFEIVRANPPVIVDGSHNPQAAAALAEAIREEFPEPDSRPVLLLGILGDKDAEGIVRELSSLNCPIVVARPGSPRGLMASTLSTIVHDICGYAPQRYNTVAEALEATMPAAVHGLIATGSLVTAGEARGWLLDGSETLGG